MKCFELTKDTLGIKAGQTFFQTMDGSYADSTNAVRLNTSMVENNTDFFTEVEGPDLWKPEQNGHAFWTITPDGGTLELPWDEQKFFRMWQYGNVFRDKEHAEELAQAIAVLNQSYQKKFGENIKKHKKEPRVMTPPPAAAPVAPPPFVPPPPMEQPPQNQPPQPPPRMMMQSPFDKFTKPGEHR